MSDIEQCPKCKKYEGFVWHYSTDSAMTNGYQTCKACSAKM